MMLDKITQPYSSSGEAVTSFLEDPAFVTFLGNSFVEAQEQSLLSVTLPVEQIDPLACLEVLDDGMSFQYYWEHPQNDTALSAGKSLLKISGEGPERFARVSREISKVNRHSFEYSAVSHSHAGLHFLGGFSFFERIGNDSWKPFGQASFTVPEWLIIRDGQLTLLTLCVRAAAFESAEEIKSHLTQQLLKFTELFELNRVSSREAPLHTGNSTDLRPDNRDYDDWITAVNRATKLIRENEFKKIVLARETLLQLDDGVTPTHIINTLRQKYPNCYTFLIRQDNAASFLGCSPERLVSFHKNYLLTEALAGSIKRGSTATEDAILEKELLHSRKNADEHNFVITAIEQALSPYVRKIERGSRPVIKKMANVQHLFTPITGWLREQVDPMQIIGSLHPTPAVGGFPWQKAEPYIKSLEDFDRGWYAGPVGWLNSSGAGDFTVAIRSGLIKENKGRFYAGCGIVADSDANAEWRETNLKLTPMLSALQYD